MNSELSLKTFTHAKLTATVPDLLPARMLKDMAEEIAQILPTMFQLSFDTGIEPRDWRTTNVMAIFKRGGGEV